MHRWIWDLRYPTPFSTEHEYPIAAVPHNTPRYPLGPTALPGQYTISLKANGQNYSTALTVKMDPRVKTSQAGLQKKFDLEMQLASAITRSSEAVSQARSIHEQIEKLTATGPLQNSVKTLDSKISVLLDGSKDSAASSEPALSANNSTVIALYKEVEKADASPTAAQQDAFTKIENELAVGLKRWDELKTADVSALNRQLGTAGLPQLRLDLPPQQEAGGQNEE